MKILFCTTFFNSTHNGAGQFAQHIFQLNNENNIDLRILSEDLFESNETATNKKYFLNLSNTNFTRGLELKQRAKYYQDKALEIYNKFAFDVIFFNNAVLGLNSKDKFPTAVKRMGFIHDDNYINFSWNNFTLSKKWAYRHLQRRFEKNAIQELDKVLTNSNYLKGLVSREYAVSKNRLAQLYVSVNFQNLNFVHDQKIKKAEPIKILFVKNEFKRGGLEDLIQAITSLSTKYTLVLTIIGPLPQQARAIQQLANSKNYRLDFRGTQTQAMVFAAMSDHHILCIPSRLEAQGVTNIEGMAIGIPVVTTNVGGIPEITNEGKHAWVAEANHPKQLAAVIENCILSPELRFSKAAAARDYVLERFSADQMLERFLTLLG